MALQLDHLLNHRDLFCSLEKPVIKSALSNETTERVDQLMRRLLEEEWLKSLPKENLGPLFFKVLCCFPVQTSIESIDYLLRTSDNFNPTQIKEGPADLFFENRPLLEKIFIRDFAPGQTKMELLKHALSQHSHAMASVLIDECYLENQNSLEDMIKTIAHSSLYDPKGFFQFLKRYKENHSNDELKKLLLEPKNRAYYIFASLFISDETHLKEYLTFLDGEHLDFTDLIVEEDKRDWLHCVDCFECLYLLLDRLPKEDQRKVLQNRGGEFFYNCRKKSSVKCEAYLNHLQKLDISLDQVLEYRHDGDPLTTLDYFCLHGQIDHLKVILKYMTDDTLWKLLHTDNHGWRNPFGHCRYYHPDSGALEIITKEYERIEASKGIQPLQ